MVPVAATEPVSRVPEKVTVKVSSDSTEVSSVVAMVTNWVCWPAAKVTDPEEET